VKLPSSSTYAYWLAILRLYTGAFWLMHGIPKFTQSTDFMPPDGMMVGFLNTQISHVSGPYQSFLMHVVLPNAWFFANLVRLGEVVAGCLLLLGFFTRFGGLIAALLALNYISAKGGLAHLSVWSGLDSTAFVLSITSVILPTGRVLGIDGLLAHLRRSPRAAEVPRAAVFVEEPPMTGPSAPSS
jgi:uncharacterized membrane protein YphA (DoxX/SURF4 family)